MGVSVLPPAVSGMFVNAFPIPHEGTGAERRRDIPEYIWLSLTACTGARSDASGGYTLLLEREGDVRSLGVCVELCVMPFDWNVFFFLSLYSPNPPR